ncbi:MULTISPECIES: DNA repair protein RecO [Xanthomonas]|uniref:DNA repair protein RecO n=1 Tax=Xanthomonas TaxID=338 RepID=UPI001ADA0456|nr:MULTISPECIES: DNA repair protein RecO [unclassified Xanthomonas]MBO9874611.1 DNA repair protein RecO [Xanthomonas sp. D-93]WNH43795.1 DNA repair protein RecO [Xanthomonas sp. A6251]
MIEHEPGFVLHARPWRETSLLVEVLSVHHGRLGVLARGVQGPKKQALRAALQPLQSIRFSAQRRGELAQLRAAEALDAAPRLSGEAMLAGFYINELTLRLAPRDDPAPDLYLAYARVRARLAADAPLAWSLRCFERDLLEALGVGFDLRHDGDGEPIDPAARYVLDAEHGPRRLLSDRGHDQRSGMATGRALLALADDTEPVAEDLPGLRRGMRVVLLHHLGGRGLKSWEMVEDLARQRSAAIAAPQAALRAATPDADADPDSTSDAMAESTAEEAKVPPSAAS